MIRTGGDSTTGTRTSDNSTATARTSGTPASTCALAIGSMRRCRTRFDIPRRACRNSTLPTTTIAVSAGIIWKASNGAPGVSRFMPSNTINPTAMAPTAPVRARPGLRPTETAVAAAAITRDARPAATWLPPKAITDRW